MNFRNCPNAMCSDSDQDILCTDYHFYVICLSCGHSGPHCVTRQDAVDAYNSLPRHGDYSEVVEALETYVEYATEGPSWAGQYVLDTARAALAKVRKP